MTTRRRGRPRGYDPESALDAATNVFWSRGYAGTTLDALSEATGMKRPSLYAAFGDKSALFDRVVARFQGQMADSAGVALAAPTIDDAIEALMLAFVDVYAPTSKPSRGCLVFSVASLETVEDERLRAVVRAAIQGLDQALRARLEGAVAAGELPVSTDLTLVASGIASQMHSLSLRARAGASRRSLRKLARGSGRLLLAGARALG